MTDRVRDVKNTTSMKTPPTTPRQERKTFDTAFKREALEHWERSGKTAEEVGSALGVSAMNLYAWKGKSRTLPVGGAGSVAPRTIADLAAENLRLRRELAHVSEQRDILKKAMGVVSENPVSFTNRSKP